MIFSPKLLIREEKVPSLYLKSIASSKRSRRDSVKFFTFSNGNSTSDFFQFLWTQLCIQKRMEMAELFNVMTLDALPRALAPLLNPYYSRNVVCKAVKDFGERSDIISNIWELEVGVQKRRSQIGKIYAN